MQIVIEIPERIYDTIQADEMISRVQLAVLQMHILEGTPLPEHHGRLIDVNELLDDIGLEDNDENRDCNTGEIITLENIDRISTIIPATKEGDEEG